MSPLLTRAARSEAEAERDMHRRAAERAEAAQNAVCAAIDALVHKLRAMAEGDEFDEPMDTVRYTAQLALLDLQAVKEAAAFAAGEDASAAPELAA